MRMINDKKIVISTGASRKSTNWQRLELNYSEFVEKLRKPIRSTESLDEFLKMKKRDQDKLKDVGGFVGGALKGSRRKAFNVESRDLITLDFDNILSGETKNVIKKVMSLGCGYVIYSTRKHSEYKPRLRIIIPSDRSMSPDEYEPVARRVALMIGIQMADPTTFEASRLMYWPSCSRDSQYVFKHEDKPFLSVDGILKTYSNWKDVSSWPQVPGEDTKHKTLLTRQQDPTTKTGLVGAFCKTYDIYSAIDKFIPEAYDAEDDGRFTYHNGSTVGGAVVYQEGLFLYSHHATDPCSNKLVNAWDLVRLHKFSDLDEEADEDTPVVRLPSYTAMKTLAKEDDSVMALLSKEKQDSASDFFESIGQAEKQKEVSEDDNSWYELLETDKNGNNTKTIANVVAILTHDPNFKGKIFIDEFANRGMVSLPLPWENGEGDRMWSDTDDAQLALRLEKEFGITGKDRIENGLKVVGFNNRKNGVKDRILSYKWDGAKRIPTLLSDYLGAEESEYTADVMKKALTAAVARAFDDKGVKFDYMVVFSGKQGIGKSTFLSKLGMEWFSDSLYSFEGKEAAELIQGTLINEVGELSAMNKSETETVKQFLSKTHDIYREAYGRRTNRYPRRCVFFGSTNSDEFLRDVTGNRRFWPVKVGEYPIKKDIFKDLDLEISQIWAEAYFYYVMGEPLYLSGESEIQANALQEDFREKDPREGVILEFLEKKIPENWYELPPQNQKAFFNNTFDVGDVELVERDKVCVAEIWQICFQSDIKWMKRRDSNEITNILNGIQGWVRNKSRRRYGCYGTQRGFEKSKIININEIKSVKK